MSAYEQGKADCAEGSALASNEDEYLAGYADQYAAEQSASNKQEQETWQFQ